MTTAYKVFTHDLRSPIQGGEPVWDGSLPYILPVVPVDGSSDDCGAGWNACPTGDTALQIAGLWPDGRPSRLFRLETDQPVIIRDNKIRAASWTVLEEIEDITPHVRKFSELFEGFADEITVEQMAWRHALSRPFQDEQAVIAGLMEALKVRGLENWGLKRFENTRAARGARDTREAKAARDTWNAWVARDARDAWDAWVARDARAVGDAWAAWDAKNTWAARDALTVWFAARRVFISQDPMLLTTGLRDAYQAGLEMAIPVGPTTLGWSMKLDRALESL